MSNKKKGAALDPSPYGSYEDARARFKHHSLIQDYLELEKETEEKKTRLVVMKQKKLSVLAEVCFLRRRKHLLEMKGTKPPQGQNPFQPPILRTEYKDTLMMQNSSRKAIKLQGQAPIFDLNMEISSSAKIFLPKPKGSCVNMKEKKNKRKGTSQNTNPGLDLNQKMDNRCVAEEVDFKMLSPVLRLNQKERLFVGQETDFDSKGLGFDVNQVERPCVLRGDVPHRAPVFDLNLISGGEELHDNYGALRSEEPMSIDGSEPWVNDLKLSMCRNMENVPKRSGKRKISWQDPVALKV